MPKLFTYGEGVAVVYCLLRNGLVLRAVANGNALTVGNRKYTIKNRQLLNSELFKVFVAKLNEIKGQTTRTSLSSINKHVATSKNTNLLVVEKF